MTRSGQLPLRIGVTDAPCWGPVRFWERAATEGTDHDRVTCHPGLPAAEPVLDDDADLLLGTAEELTKLAGLHDHGVLSDSEYADQKAKLLA